MKILVVGGGGREHALTWKIAKSPLVKEIVATPGNAGIASLARCENITPEDIDGVIALAQKESVDLVVVGPEAPLVAGLADKLTEKGILAFGPSAAAAALEGSKVFAKEFMARHGIPTAPFSVHTKINRAMADIDTRSGPCVVKADGLAQGKGVVICPTALRARRAIKEMLGEHSFGKASERIVIENYLSGEEISVLAICDGERLAPLIPAQDHKAAFEGDGGPNTGGMGAYAPVPAMTPELEADVIERILKPTVKGMAEEGRPFRGVLYAGLIIDNGKPYVLEFNVRFGDPECQPLMLMMESDLVPLLKSAAEGSLTSAEIKWRSGAALCVVLAAAGYPGPYEKGKVITGLDAVDGSPHAMVFHAGTARQGDTIVTSGGRVLGVTAWGADIGAAAQEAYAAANWIHWDGMRMRRDIGHRAL